MKKITLLIVLLLLASSGCRRPLERVAPPSEEQGYLQNEYDKRVEDSVRLQNTVNNMLKTEDAVVVIKGEEVYVGTSAKEGDAKELSKDIINTIRRESDYEKVYVTTEEKSVNTLRSIKAEVLRGVDVEQYRQELNNIRDLMIL